MIELKNISKSYGKNVLKDVTYTFEKNKIYVIKGISGCGKTTLLNILGGLDSDFEGEYLYQGRNIGLCKPKEKARFRQEVGYIFQSSLLMSKLTVLDNLLYINNDKELIRKYAKQLHVEELLGKYPEQLSGGQRQRISIIRALILNPEIILADEPTASLDRANSKELAKLFSVLRNEDRIIIIATHENCFDDVADEIINLGYGVIKAVERRDFADTVEEKGIVSEKRDKSGSSVRVLLPLIFRRHREKYRIKSLLPLSLIILIVMICFGLQHNFKDEAIKYCRSKYPMNVIAVENMFYDSLVFNFDDMETYFMYCIENDDFDCYPLLSEEDSVLSYGNLIRCGEFPEGETDVIINNAMALDYFGETDEENCIGKKLTINDVEYTVTAVLASPVDNDVDWSIYESDIYYKSAEKSNLVFIPYDTIKEYGKASNQKIEYSFMVKIPNLYEDNERYEETKAIIGGQLSTWDGKLKDAEKMVDKINKVVRVAFIVAAVISVLFVKNDIEVDLFYRKKELGYMQIFGVRKGIICFQLILERLTKNTVCLLISLISYNIIAWLVKLTTGISGFIAVSYILILFALVVGCSLVSAVLPIRKFMKKSVLKLITE